MKFLVTLFLLALAIVASVQAQMQVRPIPPKSVFPSRDIPLGLPRPRPQRPLGPTLPRPPVYRIRRDVNLNVDLDRGRPSWNVQGNHKVYENKHGSIHVNGDIGSHRGGRPRGQIGISGAFRFPGK